MCFVRCVRERARHHPTRDSQHRRKDGVSLVVMATVDMSLDSKYVVVKRASAASQARGGVQPGQLW